MLKAKILVLVLVGFTHDSFANERDWGVKSLSREDLAYLAPSTNDRQCVEDPDCVRILTRELTVERLKVRRPPRRSQERSSQEQSTRVRFVPVARAISSPERHAVEALDEGSSQVVRFSVTETANQGERARMTSLMRDSSLDFFERTGLRRGQPVTATQRQQARRRFESIASSSLENAEAAYSRLPDEFLTHAFRLCGSASDAGVATRHVCYERATTEYAESLTRIAERARRGHANPETGQLRVLEEAEGVRSSYPFGSVIAQQVSETCSNFESNSDHYANCQRTVLRQVAAQARQARNAMRALSQDLVRWSIESRACEDTVGRRDDALCRPTDIALLPDLRAVDYHAPIFELRAESNRSDSPRELERLHRSLSDEDNRGLLGGFFDDTSYDIQLLRELLLRKNKKVLWDRLESVTDETEVTPSAVSDEVAQPEPSTEATPAVESASEE